MKSFSAIAICMTIIHIFLRSIYVLKYSVVQERVLYLCKQYHLDSPSQIHISQTMNGKERGNRYLSLAWSPNQKNELTDRSTVITKYLEMRCPLKGFIADMANVYSFLAMNLFTMVHQHGGWRERLTTLKTLVHTTFFLCLTAFSHIRRNLCHL